MTYEAGAALKSRVKQHWEGETCGTRYSNSDDRRGFFDEITTARYGMEPYIAPFADFPSSTSKVILEIGVGAGADFQNWCRYANHATGVDLAERAIALTRERLKLCSIPPERYTLLTTDTERLPFADDSFDIVYSWGVLHHTPDTDRAFSEAFRVLKPGGTIKVMIYHHPSWTGLMLYLRHALARADFKTTMREVVFDHLESPGTKTYTAREAARFLSLVGFSRISLLPRLGPGDLLTIRPSNRYDSPLYRLIWRIYPRWLVRLIGDRYGLNLLISAVK